MANGDSMVIPDAGIQTAMDQPFPRMTGNIHLHYTFTLKVVLEYICIIWKL